MGIKAYDILLDIKICVLDQSFGYFIGNPKYNGFYDLLLIPCAKPLLH